MSPLHVALALAGAYVAAYIVAVIIVAVADLAGLVYRPGPPDGARLVALSRRPHR